MHLQRKGEYVGSAEFTRDMVKTMLQYFDTYADKDGVLKLEVREGGIFLPPIMGQRSQFLGLARLSKYIAKARH